MAESKTRKQTELDLLQQQYDKYPQMLRNLEEASSPLQEFFGISSNRVTAKLEVRRYAQVNAGSQGVAFASIQHLHQGRGLLGTKHDRLS